MKKRNIILMFTFNVLFMFGLVYLWQSSIETKIGGVCNYWRCVNQDISMFPIYLVIVSIINAVFLVLYIVDGIKENKLGVQANEV